MTNNTIPNVPRDDLDLIRVVLEGFKPCIARDDALRTVRAILSAPSPAGVDGCKCSMSISMLGDGCRYCQPQEYIDRLSEMLDEERAELSDAQAIIDGLRGENEALHAQVKVLQSDANSWQSGYDEGRRIGGKHCSLTIDQQAQRIGELEGLLLGSRKHVAYAADHCEQAGIELDRIDAALSAGKDSVS